ncbi:MAG: ATP-binding cassette domain-containing protein [Chloroflexi bacterium]|nr:ATP-binding cassette domain-containing protein [Chloroflexota bacterium]
MLIEVERLEKTFRVALHRPGRFGALTSLVWRDYRTVHAVRDVSFAIDRGEMVGCLGPNGAGKSTTIKMLTGILVPSGGRIEVLGQVPYRRRKQVAQRIGVVFGQRTQLWWDLPLIDSLDLLRYVYRVDGERYARNLRRMRDLLDLDPFLRTPVRQLSLGQRMRGDLAAALLHDPEILYLDEPTIGLDVVAKHRVRDFLLEINRQDGVTVLLTTHDMADVEQLCSRLLIIDRGTLLYDGSLNAIRDRLGTERTLVVDLADDCPGALEAPYATEVRADGPRRWLQFSRLDTTAAELIAAVAARYPLRDLTIEESDIETIVRRIYEQGLDARTMSAVGVTGRPESRL